MKILLVSPLFPDTFWSFKYAIKFLNKKATFPPLGLLTVASILPEKWEKKLIDMNVTKLSDTDLLWADYVFIGAMIVQRQSVNEIVKRCRNFDVKTVGGGPLFTMEHLDYIDKIDHLVLDEAEGSLPNFINDLQVGNPKKVYRSDVYPDITNTPAPLWDLINLKKYASLSIQYSRGCPFYCDFCNVTSLFGRKMRKKVVSQIINELNILYDLGYRGSIFFVDDNFIGTIKSLKQELLPALIEWKEKHVGIHFFTEVSINISDDVELMNMMRLAGFDQVFIGIETPSNEGLAESSKDQNYNRNLTGDIKKIQRHGLQVQGGFIVGFDSDSPSIFQKQIDFIQECGITTAMVGLLQAPPGTKLYKRLLKAKRLNNHLSGDNFDGSTNIIPLSMDINILKKGYKVILQKIYSPKFYYKRIKVFLREYQNQGIKQPIKFNRYMAFLRSLFIIGVLGKERFYYWNLLIWTLLCCPKNFALAVNLTIIGFHFRKTVKCYVK
jgi:radical SAM superfamily enzyme YgiQ (UPF0313 family)